MQLTFARVLIVLPTLSVAILQNTSPNSFQHNGQGGLVGSFSETRLENVACRNELLHRSSIQIAGQWIAYFLYQCFFVEIESIVTNLWLQDTVGNNQPNPWDSSLS